MKYEDMSMTQLKSLCQDKGLGTGRSRKELIDKLATYDNRVIPSDIDLTEEQIDEMMDKGEPVDLAPAPKDEPDVTPEDEDPSPTIFRISFSHTGMLLDSDHEAFRKKTYALAVAEGLLPFGNDLTPRLAKCENGQLTYEVEVHG